MVCIILAAGKNIRLDNGIPKSLSIVGNETLLERHINLFQKIGVTKFCIVVGYRNDMLEEYISNLTLSSDIDIQVVYNKDYSLQNGHSLLCAADFAESVKCEEFFFTMADHYFDFTLLQKVKTELTFSNDELKLVVDAPGDHNRHIDLEDVTKVKSEEGFISNIGKEITDYNYFDTGLFYAKKSVFSHLKTNILQQKGSISDLVQFLSQNKKSSIIDLTGHYWNDIDTHEDLSQTRKDLLIEVVNQ
ncbi:NTP transferase domain-containing protein [Reichenbachiella sp. MALMAid0571]|uniref:phosphocholine cytidylyltransferase family protein n=1 Tax=Reichenbachiella sp. MALMAid0571 TaxID=3143939 RepID=UPI0032DF37AA